MSKPYVYISKKLPQSVLDWLSLHCDWNMWNGESNAPRTELLKAISEAEGLITTGGVIDEELLAAGPQLKVVSNVSVGYNNFNIEAMKRHQVVGTHTPYVLDDSVADLIMGLMLAVARRISELDQWVKSGGWTSGLPEAECFGLDVHHATLGIIGMGRIGEAVAKRAFHGFSMNVLYHNRSRKPDAEVQVGAQYVPLDTLLRESDFVVLLTPLTPYTVHFIGAEQFNLMKKTAYLINASRGQTVDEQALVRALEQGLIRGAALDVYTSEPVSPHHPLLKFKQVVTLPHIGSATAATRLKMAKLAAQNTIAVLKQEGQPHIVKELRDVF